VVRDIHRRAATALPLALNAVRRRRPIERLLVMKLIKEGDSEFQRGNIEDSLISGHEAVIG